MSVVKLILLLILDYLNSNRIVISTKLTTQGRKPCNMENYMSYKIQFTERSAAPHVRAILLIFLFNINISTFAAVQNTDGADKQSAINSIVAIVNDDVITQQELDSELDTIKKQISQQRSRIPPDDILKKQVLDRLILMNLQLHLAKQFLLTVDDESLNQAIESVAQKNGMELGQFRRALETSGIDFSDYREHMRNEIIISRLQQRMVMRKINVTDQEIKDFLANQELRERSGEEYRLQHILFVVPEAASASRIQQVKSKADEVLAKLKSGGDFSQLAMANSDGQQALEGGDLGWRKLQEIPSIFADLITKMKIGEISDLIRSPSGFHIIRLAEKRENAPQHVVEQTLVRHILIRTDNLVSSDEALAKIKLLKQRIDSGEDFTKIAITHSEDKGSAGDGGSLGWVSPGTMVKDFEETMNKLKPGEVSEPVKTRYGWHLVKVENRREYNNTEDYLKNKAREYIQRQKLGPALDNWLRQIRDEAFVELRL